MPEEPPEETDDIAYVERGAFIVKPTWKFLEWINSLEAPPEEESSVFRHTIYLMEGTDCFDAANTVEWLDAYYPDIAALEFAAWWEVEEDWPPIRSMSDFLQYFECTPSETVIDLTTDLPIYGAP